MNDTPRPLDFPPLLSGEKVTGDPLQAAIAAAARDVEPGLIHYAEDPATFRVALTLAPEQALRDALPVTFAAALGAYDAIGALTPPEVACHVTWPGSIKINGATCGHLRAAAATDDPDAEPDWLIVALDLSVAARTSAPGGTPDVTTLHDEGAADITVPDLIEAFARHTMNWLHIYLTDGLPAVAQAWLTKAEGYQGEITQPEPGIFLGLDDYGGLILKTGTGTRTLSLLSGLNIRKGSGEGTSPESKG